MKLKDLFVPKYLHSNPEVRLKVVDSTTDKKLLHSIAEQDSDARVKRAATARLQKLKKESRQVA